MVYPSNIVYILQLCYLVQKLHTFKVHHLCMMNKMYPVEGFLCVWIPPEGPQLVIFTFEENGVKWLFLHKLWKKRKAG